ncbi:PTS glucose transporter subunit IIA [uncultured Eubacterium sp.]|uniref:PTS sugar transporter subunit IIA n=1 Tax=uncultured Eubacterium sp. TaxID=165185 RepID=UPI0025D01ED5|nr:PTS glucose transporter subunit IIA [uncultured Eubacterium sp.]
MFKFLKKGAEKTAEAYDILSPVQGSFVALEQVNDEVFSSGMVGKGAAVNPTEGTVKAPFAGTVETVFPTGHAYGLKSREGVEVLIHIGLDTVEMNGDGFASSVSQGAQVKEGDVLGTFSTEKIVAAGYDPTVIVVVTNTDDYEEVTAVAEGAVNFGNPLVHVVKGA